MAYGENGGIDVQMPVVPAYGGGYGMPFMGGGFGGGLGYGGDGLVWLILIVLLGGGAWGGMGGFGLGGFGGYGIGDINGLYWLNNSQNINDGFRDQMIDSSIKQIQNSITSGFGDTQLAIAGVDKSICQTGNGITAAMNTGFANAETGANARQMANMQQLFGVQTTLDNHLDQLTMALQQCCCDNKAAIADLKYTVATENCEDRAAIKDGLYALTTQNNANTQQLLNAIKALDDARCQDKIDAKNERIAELQQQLNFANLQASQIAQDTRIVDSIYNRLSTCPVGTTPVYGNQPIFTCPQTAGPYRYNTCGCGNCA